MGSISSQRMVGDAIRRRIISGELPAGSRLPTRDALAELFATSPSTVQAAVRGLVAEGSVVTRKRAGAFVAAEPPECCRFALVVDTEEPLAAREPAFFLDHLIRAAGRLPELRPGWRMDAWRAGDPALEAVVASGALAGILYFGAPTQIPAAAAGAGVPLALFSLPDQPARVAVSIAIDNQELFEVSLRSLLARGQTRIGLLETGMLLAYRTQQQDRVAQLVTAMQQAGAAACPEWIQYVDPLRPHAVQQTTRLLLGGSAAARPGALILMDDHLLPPVQAAIRALGLRVPADVAIAVASFADPRLASDGCIRIGFDIEAFLLDVVSRLSAIRQGKAAASTLRTVLTER